MGGGVIKYIMGSGGEGDIMYIMGSDIRHIINIISNDS